MIKTSRPVQKGVYKRHRLFEKLDRMLDLPAIWVSAPGGSGKTTLISSFIEDRKIPCLWYQIDKGDNDLATFFYYMGQAVRKAAPGRRKAMPLLTPEYYHGIPTFTMNYFEELKRRLKIPSILVLDNYQEVSANSPFNEMINDGLSRISSGMNVIFISRGAPPSSFIRLKANSQMELLGWNDVRLSKEETLEIVQYRMKDMFSSETAHQLHNLSDGWAAGLILMMEAMKLHRIKPELVKKYASDEIFVYFAQEVFSRLERDTRDFLMTTAFLPQMTAGMAEELTGNQRSGEMLQDMNRNNYFVSIRIHSDPVFEYHPLYRDFLLSVAGKAFPDEKIIGLQRTAAMILEKAGQTEGAFHLASANGDWDQATSLIMTHAPEMLKQGRFQPLREWLERVPSNILEEKPWLVYFKGMSILFVDPRSAKKDLEGAYSSFQAAEDRLGAMLAACGIVHAIVYGFQNHNLLDHWYSVLSNLTAGLEAFPDEEIEAMVISGLIAASYLGKKAHPNMQVWAERALEIVESPSTVIYKAHSIVILIRYRLLYQSAHRALPLLDHLERLAKHHFAPPVILLIFHSAQVLYNLVAGFHDALLEAAERGLEISSGSGIHTQDVFFQIHGAASFVNCMDLKKAEMWIKELSPSIGLMPYWAQISYHCTSARIDVVKKDLGRALHEGERAITLTEMVGDPFVQSMAHIIFALVHNKMGVTEKAFAYIEKADEDLTQMDCRSHIAIVKLLKAQFAYERGDEESGRRLLRAALAMAREGGYVFGLFDDPADVIVLCEKALQEGIETEHVRSIIRRRRFVPDRPPIHIEEWPWALKIKTLGGFSLVRDDEPFEFSRKVQQRPLALLKVLIGLGGKEVREERISEVLWPEADGDMAHQSFDTTLHRLRKLLKRPEALTLRDGRVTLDRRYCWVDAWAFEYLVDQAEESKQENNTNRARALFEEAIGLYKGDYLAGEREEPLLISTSEGLKSLFLKSASWLGLYFEKAGQWQEAADHYEQFLQVDPCREDFYRQLMVCMHKLNRKSEALFVYQRCRRALSSMLAMNPSPETEAVCASILKEQKS